MIAWSLETVDRIAELSCECSDFTQVRQGAYKSGKPGKPGNLREFCKSGKLRENSGNLKCTLEFLEPTTISDKNVGQ